VVLVLLQALGALGDIDPTDIQQDVRVLTMVLALSVVYYTLFEGSALQATPGKKALRLRVTDLAGRRISLGRAAVRQLAKLISGVTFYLGYVLAGFTPRRQALHDLLAGCLVVRA
jgi:uncharacterized RDD family membrane protein YckC